MKLSPARGLKRLGRMLFPRNPIRMWTFSRTKIDYQHEVGDGTGSSTVMAPLFWMARTFPEAKPMLWAQHDDGQETPERRHPMLRLLERPNHFYTGRTLWMATLIDWNVDGNAYWIKLRDGTGTVKELWWVPHWLLAPKSPENSPNVFISHYEYKPGYEDAVKVNTEDVVHFRFSLDPDDPRLGRSQLKSVLREVYTDEEAASFTAQLLRNMGVPGLVVSPETDTPPSLEDVKETKEYLKTAFSGDQRGEPLVMSGPTKIAQFGFSPEQLLLKELRRIPEERVTAVFGVPAIVAGLGAGLDRSTFTNYTEAREAAYEQNIIPTQSILSEDIRFQLLNDFEADVFDWRFGFDLSEVRVLQEDEDKKLRRVDVAVRGGWGTVADARHAAGFKVVPDRDNIFLRPLNVQATGMDGKPVNPPPAPPENGNGDGPLDERQLEDVVGRALAAQA